MIVLSGWDTKSRHETMVLDVRKRCKHRTNTRFVIQLAAGEIERRIKHQEIIETAPNSASHSPPLHLRTNSRCWREILALGVRYRLFRREILRECEIVKCKLQTLRGVGRPTNRAGVREILTLGVRSQLSTRDLGLHTSHPAQSDTNPEVPRNSRAVRAAAAVAVAWQ